MSFVLEPVGDPKLVGYVLSGIDIFWGRQAVPSEKELVGELHRGVH